MNYYMYMDTADTFRKHFSHVMVREDGDSLCVAVIWKNVDRPDVGGWGLKKSHRSLANRLAAALATERIHANAEVKTDVNGQTYVSSHPPILGRKLNADLKRLGF